MVLSVDIGSIRAVLGDHEHLASQRANQCSGVVQISGVAATGAQVGRQFHRLLLVQWEVSRDTWPRVSLPDSAPSSLLLLRVRDHQHWCQLPERRHADHCRSHRQRLTNWPVVTSSRTVHCWMHAWLVTWDGQSSDLLTDGHRLLIAARLFAVNRRWMTYVCSAWLCTVYTTLQVRSAAAAALVHRLTALLLCGQKQFCYRPKPTSFLAIC